MRTRFLASHRDITFVAVGHSSSPDIEDVQHVAHWVLAHRLVKNYKAEAESISTQNIISKLL